MTCLLTNLDTVTCSLGVTKQDAGALLNRLIEAVSERITTITGTSFCQTRRAEWYDHMPDDRRLILRHRPVMEVIRVATSCDVALSATYTGSAFRAIMSRSNDAIVLRSTTSGGTETATTLDFATYPTTDAMATAITAVADWTSTAPAVALSTEVFQRTGQDAKDRQAVLYAASEASCEYQVDTRRGIIMLGSLYDRPEIWNPPVFEGEYVDTFRFQGVFVDYVSGYEKIPADLEQITIDLVKAAYMQAANDPTIRSESLGDYSYTLASQIEIDEDTMRRIGHWRLLA